MSIQALPDPFSPDGPLVKRASVADLKRIAAGLVLLNVLALGLCAAMLWWRWQDEIAMSRLQTTNTATLLARGANATLDKASLALTSVADQVERAWQRGGLEPAAVWPMVDKATARVPEVQTVGLFDQDGRQICGLPENRCRHLDVVDREYFKKAKSDPAGAPSLFGPIDSRLDGQPALVLARGLQRPDGSFGGVAISVVPLKGFVGLVSTASLGPNGVASLRLSASFRLLARNPNLAAEQVDLQAASVSSYMRDGMRASPEGGVFRARSAVDGLERVNAYQRLAGYPIYAIVGDATQDSLVGWRDTLYWTAGFLILFGTSSVLLYRAIALSHHRQLQAQRLYDEAPCGYHTLDSQGRFLSINATELEWLGCAREEVVGKLGPTEFTNDAGRATFADNFPQLLAGRALLGLELDLLGRDGAVRRVAVSATRVTDRNGRFVCTNSVVHDITAQKRAEEARLRAIELEAQNVALRESGRVKDEFLANMSHELRTPLNAVIGFAQLLRTDSVRQDPLKSDRFAQQIADSGQHLLGLVQTVLDFAKSEAGKLEFKPETVHVPAALNEVADMLLAKQSVTGVTVEVLVDDHLDTVLTDPLRLRQMVLNLVSNAIKFSNPGGQVELRAHGLDAQRWVVEVEDHGIGIKAEDLGRLFQSFVQLSSGSTKAFGGTGLGLALVRQIARAQGGDITVLSELGVGSVFTLTLPRSLEIRT